MPDYHHDILNYWCDYRNTRFLATMKQIGFDLPSLGSAYHHMKYYYFAYKNQFKFPIFMDALRFGVEQVRMDMLKNLARSRTLALYQCDFEQAMNAFGDSIVDARNKAQHQHNIIHAREDIVIPCQEIIDFANSFLQIASENQDSLKKNTFGWAPWERYRAFLPEAEKADFLLLRSNRKESWRGWTCDIPARLVSEMRLAHAEQRMEDLWQHCDEHGRNSHAGKHTESRKVKSSREDIR
tara:strand:+ start:2131 stop:2847 length:717 start_codon:yes stop_codon:yes gene_type:complete